MKTNLFILLILLCIGAKNYAQNVNIPDANFKAALIGNTAINTNGDSEIQVSEANVYTGIISVNNLGISNLEGIAFFKQLRVLHCSKNKLMFLDVSNNKNLFWLNCDDNNLSCLDISNNTALQILDCRYNKLNHLDIYNNIALEFLHCDKNQITSLDVSNNKNLLFFYCENNLLTKLDVSNNYSLLQLSCGNNLLSSLNVFNNINLELLYCENDNLTNLNISNNHALKRLYCVDNKLTFLDISNNDSLIYFCSHNNPNLSCIQVSNIFYSNASWKIPDLSIDPQMYFSLDCSNVSIAENLASALSILPNPASNYLYISYEGEKKLSFAISDIWGKTLAAWEAHFAGTFYQKEVSLANFPSGIYFLAVKAGDKTVVKKFVKV